MHCINLHARIKICRKPHKVSRHLEIKQNLGYVVQEWNEANHLLIGLELCSLSIIVHGPNAGQQLLHVVPRHLSNCWPLLSSLS
jgi:hypothetical protein